MYWVKYDIFFEVFIFYYLIIIVFYLEVVNKVGYIILVFGGVGLMIVVMLIRNIFMVYKKEYRFD